MEYQHDQEQALKYRNSALKRIEKENLPPSPEIYEVWYVYYSGQSPEIAKAIDSTNKTGKAITVERCKELHLRYLSDTRNAELVQQAGTQISSTINSVAGAMRDVKSATSQYSGQLDGVSKKMATVNTPEEMKAVLSSVMGDTKAMLQHNQKVEQELDNSTKVIQELQRDLENVRKEALTDGLTGLSNRKAFDKEIRRIAEESIAEDTLFTLIMLDIDHFKSFNDNFGHQIGDQVLRLVAKTLTDGVKGQDMAARYGGEEFSIILPGTPLTPALTVADSLRKAVATKDVVNRNTGEKLSRITLSCGVAEYSSGEEVEELIERADSALYTAKHNGRNQVAAAPTPTKGKKQEAV